MRYRDLLRKRLRDGAAEAAALWPLVCQRSEDYRRALGLTPRDLARIRDQQQSAGMYPDAASQLAAAFLVVSVGSVRVGLRLEKVCAHAYGARGWVDVIMAIADADECNRFAGNGTARINAVPHEMHADLVRELKHGEVAL